MSVKVLSCHEHYVRKSEAETLIVLLNPPLPLSPSPLSLTLFLSQARKHSHTETYLKFSTLTHTRTHAHTHTCTHTSETLKLTNALSLTLCHFFSQCQIIICLIIARDINFQRVL